MSPIELQRFSAFFVPILFVASYQEIRAQVLVPTKILVITILFLVLVGWGTCKRLEIKIL